MNTDAAAPQAPGAEAPSTTNPEALTPATTEAPAPEPEQVFTPEEAKEIKSFLDNNGGLEKIKKNLTMRQTDTQAQAQPQAQVPQPDPLNDSISQTPPVQVQQPQPIPGGITQEEFMTQQYFNSLANIPEYASIKDQMVNGEVLKQMAQFDIKPVVNGMFNDQKVRAFLDMYAKTVPPKPAEAPMTTTPTVDYVQVGETITNVNEAMAVLAQDKQLRMAGMDGHPMAKAANEFFDNALNARSKAGRVQHKTLESKA